MDGEREPPRMTIRSAHPTGLLAALASGVVEPDRRGRPVCYRLLRDDDDLDHLTELLHTAYRPLAEAGMHFVASHQDVEVTRRRCRSGIPVVAELDGEVVGTITLSLEPARPDGPAHYRRPEVTKFGQFAVRPTLQGGGIGSRLVSLIEDAAREKGYRVISLDTSQHARHLIAMYGSMGYRFVDYVKWDAVNYRSLVLAKELWPGAGDALHASVAGGDELHASVAQGDGLRASVPVFGTPPSGAFVERPAAYALIRDSSGNVLAVRARKGFFLPGGGAEKGESPLENLRREMLEETGFALATAEHETSAVQHYAVDGVQYRMAAAFYAATLGERLTERREYEMHWIDPADDGWYHACHAWAARLPR
jgi:predicted N-acetyltransferase YhbS/8-oxo-dGTP pyrophosphatase MutT (NUDIX family)